MMRMQRETRREGKNLGIEEVQDRQCQIQVAGFHRIPGCGTAWLSLLIL